MPPKLYIQDGQIIFVHRKHFFVSKINVFFSNWNLNLSHCTVSPRSVLEPNCPHGWSAMSGTLLSQSQIVPIYWGLTHYVAISRVQFFTAALRQIALTVHWNTSGPLCWALRRLEEHFWRKQSWCWWWSRTCSSSTFSTRWVLLSALHNKTSAHHSCWYNVNVLWCEDVSGCVHGFYAWRLF